MRPAAKSSRVVPKQVRPRKKRFRVVPKHVRPARVVWRERPQQKSHPKSFQDTRNSELDGVRSQTCPHLLNKHKPPHPEFTKRFHLNVWTGDSLECQRSLLAVTCGKLRKTSKAGLGSIASSRLKESYGIDTPPLGREVKIDFYRLSSHLKPSYGECQALHLRHLLLWAWATEPRLLHSSRA